MICIFNACMYLISYFYLFIYLFYSFIYLLIIIIWLVICFYFIYFIEYCMRLMINSVNRCLNYFYVPMIDIMFLIA